MPRPGAVLAAVALCLLASCSGSAPDGERAGPPSAAPARSPAATPTVTAPATPSPTAPPGGLPCPGTACVTLTLTGDVLLHPPLWEQARRDAHGSTAAFDFRSLLAGQRAVVSSSDLAFCHLETPLAPPGGPYRGYPSFTVPPQIATALRSTGYDACTTASNHTLDDGTAGITRTLDDLDAAGVKHAGSARTAAESARTTTFDVRGTKVALLAYAYGLNGRTLPAGQAWRVHLIDPAGILADAHRARADGADVVVVALHWGTEYVHAPTAEQRALADRLLASRDVDLVYGHHAHVVQPVQRLHGKWVVYGLGNDVAAHSVHRLDNREGLLVRVQLVRDAAGRWHDGRLDWVASYVPDSPPYRWVDLGAAVRQPAPTLSPAARAAYRRSEHRTEQVVDSLGAEHQGAHELLP